MNMSKSGKDYNKFQRKNRRLLHHQKIGRKMYTFEELVELMGKGRVSEMDLELSVINALRKGLGYYE